jgi:hypothetical protein
MNRCVVIHPAGDAELQNFHPVLHQRLRGLGYKRFVIQFLRSVDHRMLSAAVYSRLTPSPWQASEAARRLWGRAAGEISLVDEQGDVVVQGPELVPANSPLGTPAQGSPSTATSQDAHAAHARMRAMDATAIEHRLRSLAHHWLYLVDRNDGDAASLEALFAAAFELEWSPGGIRTREELSAWYRGVSERVLKSSHTLARFQYEALDSGRYGVRLELQWYGFTRAEPEQELEARTLHEWTVTSDPSDQFARIERARIRIVVPAQPRRR